jgi:hypothetical protein
MSFVDAIAANNLIAEAIQEKKISEHNLAGLEYTKHWDNI